MGAYTDKFDNVMGDVAKLAMNKMQLDMANQRWQDQLAETKRGHAMNAGLKFLEAGDVTNAVPLLQQVIPGLNEGTLTQSPVMKLKQAQTDEAVRALAAKKNIQEDLLSRMSPRTVEEPMALGIGGEIPEGVEAPTVSRTIPGKQSLSLQDLIDASMRHDPTGAALLNALKTQTSMESATEKLKLMADHYNKLHEIGSRNADSRALTAEAAMLRAELAGRGGSGRVPDSEKKLSPSYDKAVDLAIGQMYLSDPAIGPTLKRNLDKAKIMDSSVDAFRVMEPHQQVAALRIKEYATEALQSGKAKTIQQAVTLGRDRYNRESGTSATGATGNVVRWTRDENGNPVPVRK